MNTKPRLSDVRNTIFSIPKLLTFSYARNDSTCWTVPMAALWLGKSSFFIQGNSNSLATIDISAGYVGLEEYVPFIVGPLTFLSTYCGPLLWYSSAVMYIVRHSSDIQR